MVLGSPKRFWSLVKSLNILKPMSNFLRDNQRVITVNLYLHLKETCTLTSSTPILVNYYQILFCLTCKRFYPTLIQTRHADLIKSQVDLHSLQYHPACVICLIWKKASIALIYKGNDPSLPVNYRPISLLFKLSKVLERCVFNRCFPHISKSLYRLQYEFRPGRSTKTQLLVVYHDMLDSIASGKEIDVIYLDLSKAFDKIPHYLMLSSFQILGFLVASLSGTKVTYPTDINV